MHVKTETKRKGEIRNDDSLRMKQAGTFGGQNPS